MPRIMINPAAMEARSKGHPVDYLSYLQGHRSRMVKPEDTNIDEIIAPVRERVLGLGHGELFGRDSYATIVQTPDGPDIEIHTLPTLGWVEERLRTSQLLIIDTETTGLQYRDGDRLLTLGVVEARMLGVVAFPPEGGLPFIPRSDDRIEFRPTHDLRFDPEGRPSTPEALAVHGLRDEDAQEFLPFAMHARTIHGVLTGPDFRVIVAHNAPFDLGFLGAEFERCGLRPIRPAVLDTRALSKQLWPDESASLDAMAARLGATHVEGIGRGAHTALADALLLARCLVPLHRAVVAKLRSDAAELEEESRRQIQAARKADRERKAARARK